MLRITPEPWTPVDTLVIGKLMALELAANLDAELMRAALVDRIGPERAAVLEHADQAALGSPEPNVAWRGALAEALALYSATRTELARQGVGGGAGSNAFAVAGRHTASGKPMLASDPHLALSLPAFWHEAHLLAPGLDAYGAGLPGAPGVLMGHTPFLAWGMTNAYADCQDAVLERLLEGGALVATANGPRAVLERAESILVRGGGTVIERCRSSAHGPFLAEGGGHALALAWTALEPGHTFTALCGLMQAPATWSRRRPPSTTGMRRRRRWCWPPMAARLRAPGGRHDPAPPRPGRGGAHLPGWSGRMAGTGACRRGRTPARSIRPRAWW